MARLRVRFKRDMVALDLELTPGAAVTLLLILKAILGIIAAG